MSRSPEKKEFIPENDLEQSLLQAARDPSFRKAFRDALVGSELLVLGKGTSSHNPSKGEGYNTDVDIFGIRVENRKVVPAFTSETRIQDFIGSPQPFISLTGAELLSLIRPGVGLVINPASACGKEFSPSELEAIRSTLA